MDNIILCKIEYHGRTLRIPLPKDATAQQLEQALQASGQVPADMECRLIANGCELNPGYALAQLGEFYFIKGVVHLRGVCKTSCREWQRTGRCSLGSQCPLHDTHDVHHSPRYVPHAPQRSCCPAAPAEEVKPVSVAPTVATPGHAQQSTRLCRNWTQTGSCRFGDKCHFAVTHTPQNLPAGMMPAPSPPPTLNFNAAPFQYNPKQDRSFAPPVFLSTPAPPAQQNHSDESLMEATTSLKRMLKIGA